MRIAAFALFVAASLLANAPSAQEVPRPLLAMRDRAAGEIRAGQAIEFDALARYSYEELKLFHSPESARLELVYPYCISANSATLDYATREALDGKWVHVAGTLLDADELDGRHVLDLSSPDGVRFRNDCVGAYVLRIETIEAIDPTPYAPRDCVPDTANFCIPPEYDDYWQFRGALVRARPVDPDAPFIVTIEAIDNFAEQPVTHMSRTALGDYVVFHRLACESATACVLETASVPRYALAAAERQGLIHRQIEIAGKRPKAVAEALAKVRYCPAAGCEGGPSISLAELIAEGS